MRVVCGYLDAKFQFMLITYQMESLEELLESITSTLQSQYSSRFIRLANPMALNATPEVLDLNIYAICSLWLSDALSENALDGDPVGDTEVASTFLGFAKLFLEGPDPLLVHWAEVMVAKIHERPTPLWPEELDAVTDLNRHLLYQLYTSPLLNTQALAFAAYKSLCLCWAYFNSKNPHWGKLLPPSMASGLTFFSLGPDQKFLLDSIWEELLKLQEEEQSQNTLAQTNEEASAEPPITTIFDPESYTVAERSLIFYFLFRKAKINQCDVKVKARFIHALTGGSLENIYKKHRNLFKYEKKAQRKRMERIKPLLWSLEDESIRLTFNKEWEQL